MSEINPVRFARAVRALSQLELSKRTEIPQCTLSLIENGYRLLKVDELKKIAGALQLNSREIKHLSRIAEAEK